MHHTFYSENTVTLVRSPNSPQPMQGHEEMRACSCGSRRRSLVNSQASLLLWLPSICWILLPTFTMCIGPSPPSWKTAWTVVHAASSEPQVLRVSNPFYQVSLSAVFLFVKPLTLSSGRTFPVYLSPSKRWVGFPWGLSHPLPAGANLRAKSV